MFSKDLGIDLGTMFTRIADGKDFAEGIESFLEKRPARFGGR